MLDCLLNRIKLSNKVDSLVGKAWLFGDFDDICKPTTGMGPTSDFNNITCFV
tara:strand:+ start:480 stop:635 length:156 start_codon:yes stop_codon:yes gene_type:complete